MSSAKKLARNTGFMLVSEVISNIISLLVLILIARYLGSEGFGKFSFIFAFVGIIMVFTGLGENFIVIREIARDKKKTRNYFGNALTLKAALLFLTLTSSIMIINLIEASPKIRFSVYLASLAMAFLILSHLYRALLQAYEIMQYEAFMKIVERILLFILVFFVCLKGGSLVYLVLMFTIVYFISFIMSFLFVTFKIEPLYFRLNTNLIKKIIKNGIPFAFTIILMTFYFRIDTLMLSLIKAYSDVGLYSASYRIMEGLSVIPMMVVIGIFPAMSRFYIKNKQHLRLLYNRAFKYLFIIALPIAVGSTLLANKIIYFIYKEAFLNSSIVLKVLIWAEIFIFLSYLMGNLLSSINKQKLFMYSTGICVILNILLNLILIPQFSYLGASVATIATQLINFVILYRLTSKAGYKQNISKIIAKPAIGVLSMALFIYFFNWMHVLIIIPLAALIYFLILFLLKAVGKEELNLIKSIISKNR